MNYPSPKDLPISLESDVDSHQILSNISPGSDFVSIVDSPSNISMSRPLSLLEQEYEYHNLDITPRTSLTPPVSSYSTRYTS